MKSKKDMKSQIYNFLEHPKGFWAYCVQIIIFALIFISVGMVIVEFFFKNIYIHYEVLFFHVNNVILGIFTIEYVLRFFTAPKKLSFVRKPFSIIDFLAIAPNYVEFVLPFFVNTTELRILRLLRLLRFSRSLRILKVFRYDSFLKKIFSYQGTILQAITPVILILCSIKVVIIFLEVHHWWIPNTNLDQLFAIIGFALGIILSEKINMTHDKFFQVENAIARLYGTLHILESIINRLDKKQGKKYVHSWTKEFLLLFHSAKANNHDIIKANEKLYKAIAAVEHRPADVHNYYLALCQDASFCLSKKEHLTPKAYDTLLHQATVLYLVLIAVFLPSVTGLISVFVATYVLYGMYYLTQDMDTIIAGEFNLINIHTTELEKLVTE